MSSGFRHRDMFGLWLSLMTSLTHILCGRVSVCLCVDMFSFVIRSTFHWSIVCASRSFNLSQRLLDARILKIFFSLNLNDRFL